MIRDNALAVAGLLHLKKGGPPIRPPQPEGLWIKVGGERYDYDVSPGAEKYRRGIYVVLKRAAPYPGLATFDATARLTCTVKRSRSNTPLQALTLLNDPVYVEAALALARRIVNETPGRRGRAAPRARLPPLPGPGPETGGDRRPARALRGAAQPPPWPTTQRPGPWRDPRRWQRASRTRSLRRGMPSPPPS